jgi:NAD(P)-dependent dehydrogenase (short-subunit alcohol dehydrogenase family)
LQELDGKVAVITGAASGIGLALAHRAVMVHKMNVVMADVDKERLDTAAAELRGERDGVIAIPTDVRDPGAVEALRDAALNAFGAVHLVCNNAGVSGSGRIWEIPLETWRWVLDIDLWGVIHGMRTFVPLLVEQGEGHIVNTASMAGLVSAPGWGPYNVAKHGVVTLSETLAEELAGTGVGVTVVCPAFVRTNIPRAESQAPPEVLEYERVHGVSRETTEAREFVRSLIDGGLEPAAVATQVFLGITEGRLYVLTHNDSWDWLQPKVDRMLKDRPAL